ncbi:hypothetical protein FNV43_RR26471 [Rhamnella rubrinervis]|uniref:Uncharacterized protein n=1 Tax=Rhamnella rubrinervis TaxID=2594499 RepID=A0A8K0DIV2_9ROSA|nr:hypothetical protein FNV43_RR26471 [Rhamnella rubrinervis]
MAIGVLDILRKSLLISSKNINFIIFTIITSLPLFFFLVYYDFPLQKFLLETNEILQENRGHLQFNELMRYLLHELTQLGFYYLAPLHLLELCLVLLIVDLTSKIYRGDGEPLTLKDMVNKPIDMAKLRGTLITFLYVFFLSSCTLLGLIWLLTTFYAFSTSGFYAPVFVFGGTLVILLTLYLAISAVWNMSVVISILEGISGTEALALSSYYSRGSGRCGFILMLLFFVLEMGLRLPCLYIGCYQREVELLHRVASSAWGLRSNGLVEGLICIRHAVYYTDAFPILKPVTHVEKPNTPKEELHFLSTSGIIRSAIEIPCRAILIDLVNFLTAVSTVYSASKFYTTTGRSMSLQDLLENFITNTKWNGPLIAFFMSQLSFISLDAVAYWGGSSPLVSSYNTLLQVIHGVDYFVALVNCLEYSAVWHTAVVISVLEDERGFKEFSSAAKLIEGRRIVGWVFMLVYSV